MQAEKDEGVKFTVEGIVTSNASGYDKDTAFFDCIYVQDNTAGINAFPVAGNFKIGDKVRVTGTTSSYQGERQLAVTKIEKIADAEAPAPVEVTAAQINDGSVLGSLVKIKGTITRVEEAEGPVAVGDRVTITSQGMRVHRLRRDRSQLQARISPPMCPASSTGDAQQHHHKPPSWIRAAPRRGPGGPGPAKSATANTAFPLFKN